MPSITGATNAQDTLAIQLEKIEKKIEILFEIDDTFYSQVEKSMDATPVNNRDLKIPVQFAPGGFFGQWNPDGGSLGRGGGPLYENAVIPAVNFRYALEWTKMSEWATEGTRAIVSTFNRNLSQAMPNFRAHMDSMCMTGGNGVLGTVASTATAAGVDTTVLSNDFGVKLLSVGQKVNIWPTAFGAPRAPGLVTITYRDVPTRTIKHAAVTGIVTGDKIVIEGATSNPPVSLLGVPYHVSNSSAGNWLGFSRANYAQVRASRVDGGGALLSLPFPRLALNLLGDRAQNAKKLKLKAWMHPAQVAQYEALGQAAGLMTIDKKATTQGLDLYFGEDMSLAGVPIKPSFKWNRTRIDILDMSSWGRAELHKPGFYTADGRKFFEVREPTDGSVVASTLLYVVSSWNLFTTNPQENAYIDNLLPPAGYV